MGRNDDDDLTEEEKARRGLALMGLLDYIKASSEAKSDKEFKAQALSVAHTFKIQYDAFLAEGFTRDEAIELTIALVNNISLGG